MEPIVLLISRKIAKTALVFVVLFGVLLLSLPYGVSVSPDVAENVPLPFLDVDPGDWFYEQVRSVFEQGLMTGTGAVTFNPNTRVTRAMAVQVLYNQHGAPDVSGMENPFTDVAEDAWYRDAVVWAVGNGIAWGFEDGTFAPGDLITRAHLTMFLNNYASFARRGLPPRRESQVFADYMDIRNYAKEAIDRFFRAMVINGRPDGSFDPQGHATRAELATMLSQFIRYSENWLGSGVPMPPYGVFPYPPPPPAFPTGLGPPVPDPPDPPPAPEYGFPCFD